MSHFVTQSLKLNMEVQNINTDQLTVFVLDKEYGEA